MFHRNSLDFRPQRCAFRDLSGGYHGIDPLGIEVVKEDVATDARKGFYYYICGGVIEVPSGPSCENNQDVRRVLPVMISCRVQR